MNLRDIPNRQSIPSFSSGSNRPDTATPNLAKQDLHRFIEGWRPPITSLPLNKPIDKREKDEIGDNESHDRELK